MAITQLIYCSQPFGFDDAMLGGILLQARRNNARKKDKRRRHAEARAKQREVQATSAKDSAPQRTAKRSK